MRSLKLDMKKSPQLGDFKDQFKIMLISRTQSFAATL
jgi:hypothetical protein